MSSALRLLSKRALRPAMMRQPKQMQKRKYFYTINIQLLRQVKKNSSKGIRTLCLWGKKILVGIMKYTSKK